MARQETDREDLMREATALRERAEFCFRGETETVIAGYRRDGALSIYFGPDPCYHFDPQRRLRRAFVDGDLYRSQGTTLARLRRVRTEKSVELQRHDLDSGELVAFCKHATTKLQHLQTALRTDEAECLQSEPPDAEVPGRLGGSLVEILREPLKLAPAIRGRR